MLLCLDCPTRRCPWLQLSFLSRPLKAERKTTSSVEPWLAGYSRWLALLLPRFVCACVPCWACSECDRNLRILRPSVCPSVCVCVRERLSVCSLSLFSFLSFFTLFRRHHTLLNPFIAIMPVIQRSAVRAASRSALRARQNAAAFSSVARAAVNASSSVRAAAPKIAIAAVKPAVQGKFLFYISTIQPSNDTAHAAPTHKDKE